MLGTSVGVHSDILSGRDCELDWEDVFVGMYTLMMRITLVCGLGLTSICRQRDERDA